LYLETQDSEFSYSAYDVELLYNVLIYTMVKYKEIEHNVKFNPVKMKTGYPLANDFTEAFTSFNNSSCMAVFGPSNSGKSTKLIQMFQKTHKDNKKRSSFYGLFDNIVLCSPSLHTIDEDDNVFKDLDPEFVFDEFNEDFLRNYYDLMNEQKADYDALHAANIDIKLKKMSKKALKAMTHAEYKQLKKDCLPKEKPFNCLILDDVGNTIRDNKILETLFNKLVCNRRHQGVCGTFIIMLLQNVKQIGPKVRSNLSHVLSLLPSGDEEKDLLYAFTGLPKKEKHEWFDQIYIAPRDNVFIDKFPKDSCHPAFYRNFNKLVPV